MSALGLSLVIVLFGLAGFFICRARAQSFEKNGQKMHSRPLYYGWWTFFLITVPSLLFLLVWTTASDMYLQHQAYDNIATQHEQKQSVSRASSSDIGSSKANKGEVHHTATEQVLTTPQKFNQSLEEAILKGLVANLPELDGDMNSYEYMKYDTVQKKLFNEKNIALVHGNHDELLPLAVEWIKARTYLERIGAAIAIILALCGGLYGFLNIKRSFRARNRVEKIIISTLFLASLIAIATTIGIILSLLFQTVHFFNSVSLSNFFFGTVWDPRFSAVAGGEAGRFGLIPLLLGTLYIAFVAMVFAVPIGLFAAIYMSEYASPRFRSIVKPLLEILAGIPTIVYGFFALMTVGPLLRDLSAALAGGQGFIQAQSVLTAGLVMGVMLIPFVSSLSDDIINAVPRALRDGSYGLGATQSETIKKVVLPAALPGIVASLLLTASRAIGETMIVVLAAGVAANITLNPLEPMTTITVKIVNQLTGDMEFNSPQTLVAFALGMTLFVLTLLMNIFALYIVRKYKEQYE